MATAETDIQKYNRMIRESEEVDYTIFTFVAVTGIIIFALYIYPLIRTTLAGVF